MNNNEKFYQRSFQTLHLSEDFAERLEERIADERKGSKMSMFSFYGISRIAAAVTACTVAFGAGGICYANDIGGIRSMLEIWINGEKTQVEAVQDGAGYTWTDEDGEEYGFGGMSFDENGNETVMSAEELAQHMNNEAALRVKDGRIILSYKNIVEDVTDMISEDGELRVHISDPLNPSTYFSFREITDDGAYGCSADSSPEEGTAYIELDSSELVMDGEPAEEGDGNTSFSTYISTDED